MAPRDSNWIQTFSGRQFWPLAPRVEDVHVPDVAHALSLTCRFTGHVARFYSVAEHAYHVSELAERMAVEARLAPALVRTIARQGLLHDGSEAYLADVASPVKRTQPFKPYRVAEARLQRVIYTAAGLPTEEHELVKRADLIMLATEAAYLLPGGPRPDWALPVEPLPATYWQSFLGWNSTYAEACFLRRFQALADEG